jgi:hypothetical protein
LTKEDESESATQQSNEIMRFNMETGNSTGIAMIIFHTNSRELLAPLDGMILAGHSELHIQTEPACTRCRNGRVEYHR